MNQEDIKFRKECQVLHNKVRKLLANNKIAEANKLIVEVKQHALAWEEYERSVKFRNRIIKHLFADVMGRQRIKIARLKQEASNEPQK